jgi:hypothetical protein
MRAPDTCSTCGHVGHRSRERPDGGRSCLVCHDRSTPFVHHPSHDGEVLYLAPVESDLERVTQKTLGHFDTRVHEMEARIESVRFFLQAAWTTFQYVGDEGVNMEAVMGLALDLLNNREAIE